MKLQSETSASLTTVTGYGDGWIEVNGVRHSQPILVMPEMPARRWPVAGFDTLTPADLASLLEWRPQVVLLGTGARQRLPAPDLMRTLHRAGCGLEAMDTRAACRTYNLLMAEGRRVLAALWPT